MRRHNVTDLGMLAETIACNAFVEVSASGGDGLPVPEGEFGPRTDRDGDEGFFRARRGRGDWDCGAALSLGKPSTTVRDSGVSSWISKRGGSGMPRARLNLKNWGQRE